MEHGLALYCIKKFSAKTDQIILSINTLEFRSNIS